MIWLKRSEPAGTFEKIVWHIAKITKTSVAKSKLLTMKDYPGYPSISCLTDFIEGLGIAAMPVRVDVDRIHDIPAPAVLCLDGPEGKLVVLRDLDNSFIEYYDPDDGIRRHSVDEFNKRWSGIAILLEADEDTVNAERDRRMISRALIALACALVLFPLTKLHALPGVIYVLNCLGAVISVVLVRKQFGVADPRVDSLCRSTLGDSCNDVINSPRSMILNSFYLSEIGAIYFFGGIISGSLTYNDPMSIAGLQLLLGSAGAAFSIAPIFYQWRIVKRWCRLCLIVSAILWTAVPFLAYNARPFKLPAENLYVVIVAYTLPLVIWMAFRSRYRSSLAVPKLEQQLTKFTKSEYVFQKLLDRQVAIQAGELSHEIVLGPATAPLELTLVSNPVCGHCAAAHRIVERLVNRNDGQVKVKFRFMIDVSDVTSTSYLVTHHLVRLLIGNGVNSALAAMQLWYNSDRTDVVGWIRNNPAMREPSGAVVAATILEHDSWCRTAGITATPTIFIGDKMLPAGFEVDDLLIHMRHLNRRK